MIRFLFANMDRLFAESRLKSDLRHIFSQIELTVENDSSKKKRPLFVGPKVTQTDA